MANFLSLPTLMLCLFAGWTTVAVFITSVWLVERRCHEMASWSAGFWCGAVGVLLLALRDHGPDFLTYGFGNALVLACVGLLWIGFRAFDRQPYSLLLALAGAVGWIATYLFVPRFSADINLRVIAMSFLIAGYSLEIARTAWAGRATEPLPSRALVAGFFASHALIYLARIPMVLVQPLASVSDANRTSWNAIVTFELFVHAIFAGMAVFALIRERAAYRYKIASEIDSLTGVLNRGAFLSRVLEQTAASRSGGALALLDVDHFKRLNDTHGHGAGDAALAALGRRVSGMLPVGAIFGRMGGEEFAIYLPRVTRGEAEALAEEIRGSVGAMRIAWEGKQLSLTVSVGLCPLAGGVRDVSALLAVADRALYASKRAGRNRTTTFEASTGESALPDGQHAVHGFGMPG